MGNFKEDIARTEAFVFDVDGVFTDGNIMPLADGDFLRAYNAKDGYAVSYAVRQGYKIFIVTGGRGDILYKRFSYLGVTELHVNVSDKIAVLSGIMERHSLDPENVLFMGDDIPDLECMQAVGLPVCPADASCEIIEASRYVSEFPGGHGCVRDIIEQVLRAQGNWARHLKGIHAVHEGRHKFCVALRVPSEPLSGQQQYRDGEQEAAGKPYGHLSGRMFSETEPGRTQHAGTQNRTAEYPDEIGITGIQQDGDHTRRRTRCRHVQADLPPQVHQQREKRTGHGGEHHPPEQEQHGRGAEHPAAQPVTQRHNQHRQRAFVAPGKRKIAEKPEHPHQKNPQRRYDKRIDRDYHQDITFYPDGQVDGQDSRPEKYQQQPYRHQKGMQQV